MTTRPVIADGLWRCLCPSFKLNAIALRTGVRPRILNGTRPASNSPQSRRTQSTTPSAFERGSSSTAPAYADGQSSGRPRWTQTTVTSHSNVDSLPSTMIAESGTTPQSRPRSKWKAMDPDLVMLPTSELYVRLKNHAARNRHEVVFNIVKILLKDRREPPNLAMYSALLLSFASAEDGTAGKIRKVLEDMAEDGIELDSQTCHNVLEALAVHPDHLLRSEILEYMRSRWFTLSGRGHNMVVAGLLRDRSFEQALEKIEDMIRQRIKVQPWVFDKAIYFLLDYGEVEEAYKLLSLRLKNCDAPVSYTLYSQLLDTAARLQFAEAAKYVWDTQVTPGYIKAPTSTCMLILSLAARTGDVNLATEVIRVFTERQIILDTHHYELLLQAYLHPAANNLSAALNIILIMTESGLRPTEASLHPLYTHLNAKKERPLEAFTMLQSFEASGKDVPTAAVNICLQSSIEHNNLPEAIEIYKALHTVSKAGPTTTTFNILFQGCYHATKHISDTDEHALRVKKRDATKKELAMFLASEMLQLGLTPNALTYDRLVHVCALAADPDDAFAYYAEMRALSLVGRKGMYEVLLSCGLDAGDPRTVAVLEDMRRNGFVPKKALARAVEGKFARGGGVEDV